MTANPTARNESVRPQPTRLKPAWASARTAALPRLFGRAPIAFDGATRHDSQVTIVGEQKS